jgi:hypothetical protein
LTAPVARFPLRSSRWRSALLASCIAAHLATLQWAEASHLATLKPAEELHLATLDSAEESRLATLALDEESQLAAYLRMHYANEQDAVTLYPLAAFAAAARRTGQYSRGSYRGGRYAFAGRDAVGAGGGATCVLSCEGR